MNAVFSKRGTSLAEKIRRHADQPLPYNDVARPNQHVWSVEELLQARPGIPLALDIRVSSNQQTRRGNHLDAELEALDLLDSLGVSDVRIFHEEGKATIPVRERPVLMAAIQYAQRRNGAVVAVYLDRLIRPKGFDGSSWSNRLTLDRMQELKDAAPGVPFATIYPPNDQRARGYQTVRGQQAKGKLGGRPKTETQGPGKFVRRKAALVELIVELRRQGLSYRKIAKHISQTQHWPRVSFSQVGIWCTENGV
ncbi:MAG TPA: hypothetical protein VG734_08525 [Lacunisphaera sp.]|nr:hypothetical protein [Lacunisphaera sp.]